MAGTVYGLTIRNSDLGSPWDPGTQPRSPAHPSLPAGLLGPVCAGHEGKQSGAVLRLSHEPDQHDWLGGGACEAQAWKEDKDDPGEGAGASHSRSSAGGR